MPISTAIPQSWLRSAGRLLDADVERIDTLRRTRGVRGSWRWWRNITRPTAMVRLRGTSSTVC